ncbi:hypothetical protein THRCLA_23273, partial [Thraustotheca clavata]
INSRVTRIPLAFGTLRVELISNAIQNSGLWLRVAYGYCGFLYGRLCPVAKMSDCFEFNTTKIHNPLAQRMAVELSQRTTASVQIALASDDEFNILNIALAVTCGLSICILGC